MGIYLGFNHFVLNWSKELNHAEFTNQVTYIFYKPDAVPNLHIYVLIISPTIDYGQSSKSLDNHILLEKVWNVCIDIEDPRLSV